jgi:hypothetical protein
MNIFNIKRKRDINLEIPISSHPDELTYYIFDSTAHNTFSKELAERNINYTPLKKRLTLKTHTLASVLDRYLPARQEIDFFSIDAEGYDFEVLKSNDWEKYRPNFILVEEHHFDLEKPTVSPIYNYLNALNYRLSAKTGNTIFYEAGRKK